MIPPTYDIQVDLSFTKQPPEVLQEVLSLLLYRLNLEVWETNRTKHGQHEVYLKEIGE